MNAAKILIIEDDSTILRVVKDNFASRGYRVQTARQGEDGGDLATAERLRAPGQAGAPVALLQSCGHLPVSVS